MNKESGLTLGLSEHLRQSIGDILTTPLGSRVMRRDYGSLLPDLIDQPTNAGTVTRLYAAVASALMRWEPRITLTRVRMYFDATPGAVELSIEAELRSSGEAMSLSVPLKMGASA